MKKILQIELNEVNFDFVKAYCAKGKLPTLDKLLKRHGLIETTSEQAYDELEPWIQWVSAHCGLSFAEHRVFRLGDILDRPDLRQIWEVLEENGYSVGAITPMNARNACTHPAFFIPDPWTGGPVVGSPLMQRLYDAIAQLVNDNAQTKVQKSSVAWLGAGLLRFARPANYSLYATIMTLALRKRWARALLLDLLLADVFIRENHRANPDFSSLFLNAAAHIQHHHMFDSSTYQGPHRNPDWYRDKSDPILKVYELYDTLLQQIIHAFPNHRLLIATGLHQMPHPERVFYWRLCDHATFLRELGIVFDRVEPRMSRDFIVFCKERGDAANAAHLLSTVTADDGLPLFEVDDRGDNLFVMLSYPNDISSSLGYRTATRVFTDLRAKCAFVAIKNGAHDGVGYLIDTSESAVSRLCQIPLKSLFTRTICHFQIPERHIDKLHDSEG